MKSSAINIANDIGKFQHCQLESSKMTKQVYVNDNGRMSITAKELIKIIDDGEKRLNISRRELATRAKVPYHWINDLIRNDPLKVDMKNAEKILDFLKVKKTKDDLSDAEVALTDAIKDILQILIHGNLVAPEALSQTFSYQAEFYREKNLQNAVRVMDELKEYVTGEPPHSEKPVIRRLLQLAPLGSA